MSEPISDIDALLTVLAKFGWWSHHATVKALVEERKAAIKQRDEAKALNKAWEQKAATWLATPEAAARLQSYRDLGQQVAQAQNERDALRAELAAAKRRIEELEAPIRNPLSRALELEQTLAAMRKGDTNAK